MDGTYFLDFLTCQVTAGELVLISFSLAFLYKLWAEAHRTHSGISWNGKPDIISEVFRAAADTSVSLGGCELVAE